MCSTSVLLPGNSHEWRSLVGCSPWGHKESDTTERPHFHFSLSCTGEGNGNPLQCSCLENPRDCGAWWAAIYGAAQSWTRLKWLSSTCSTEFKLSSLLCNHQFQRPGVLQSMGLQRVRHDWVTELTDYINCPRQHHQTWMMSCRAQTWFKPLLCVLEQIGFTFLSLSFSIGKNLNNHSLGDLSWFQKRQRNQRSNCQHLLDHQKSKRVPEKHLFLLYWLCQSLWLCGSQ